MWASNLSSVVMGTKPRSSHMGLKEPQSNHCAFCICFREFLISTLMVCMRVCHTICVLCVYAHVWVRVSACMRGRNARVRVSGWWPSRVTHSAQYLLRQNHPWFHRERERERGRETSSPQPRPRDHTTSWCAVTSPFLRLTATWCTVLRETCTEKRKWKKIKKTQHWLKYVL